MNNKVLPHPTATRRDPAPQRALHFVGSLPPSLTHSEQATMQWFLDHADGHELLTLPCDRDSNWIIDWFESLSTNPALRTVREGTTASYETLPAYAVADGHRLVPEDITLNRIEEIAPAMDARAHLDSASELPPQQVSIPNALDLAYFCFGAPRRVLPHLPVFRDALIRDVTAIHTRWPDEVVFQLETPAVLIMFDRTPRQLWHVLAVSLARQVEAMILAAPSDVRWIIHLCYGDLGHKPLVKTVDLIPAVLFLNALDRRLLKSDRAMPRIHLPMCSGTTGPSTDRRFHRPLAHLRRSIQVIAGVVEETQPEDSRRALELVETALDRPALGVAAACGHGRRSPEAAAANTSLARSLARRDL
ncbi:hypothetical protein FPZ12_008050 [Amycolatopsis acidicola]|uniref:Cobalamin-independent methionine synthase MetE C-terminal/archaeal domain-containing protein n=1 Tax=Amycolatopsis acidicola TaxID=2596893 RepID=A0A5N0VEZ1_9PSEU|nr:hypothetical protein [Amycolatopsis acidicola]KAA9163973.1 hypothetical protein FPZ12_008050 [Amycolatopsis acidicola]